MNFYNSIKTALLSGFITISFASCNSDIDTVYVNPSNDSSLGGATGDIILSPKNPQSLAMTIYWSGDGELALSNPLLQAPLNAADETIQVSKDRKSTRLNSSHANISYAVFCLKKKQIALRETGSLST